MAGLSTDSIFRIKQHPEVTASSINDELTCSTEELGDQIHRALGRTRNKITNLKQEVHNKDRVIQRERAMRKAAERHEHDKVSEGTYVDPYAGSTPSVNEELKQWLSPAAQRSRLMGRGNPSPGSQKQRASPQGKGRPRTHYTDDAAEGQEHLTESYYSSEEDGREDERRGREDRSFRRDRRGRSELEEDQRRKYNPGAWYGDYGPVPPFPGYAPHNPWVSPQHARSFPAGYHPGLMHTIGPEFPTNHFAHHATSTPNQQHRRNSLGDLQKPFTVPTLVIPASAQGAEGDQGVGKTVAGVIDGSSPSNPREIPRVTIQIRQSPNASQLPKTPQRSPAQGESKLDTSLQSETVTTGVGASPPPMHTSHHFDERGLPLLLDELGACKDKNKQLSEKNGEAEKEIESLKMQLGVKDAMSEAEIAAKGAALIEEIYTAQREHDEAIIARMRLANEERDDALSRLHKYQSKDGFDSGTDVNSNEEDNSPGDSSLNNLLSRLTSADNRVAIDRYGSAIVGRISKTKGRRQLITSEEMRAILKEKDIAVAKCKRLEKEIIELQKNRENIKSRNNNEKSLKAQLDITRDERDKALVAVKKLKDEIDSLKMYYNLHKSLSQEANLRDQFNTTLGSIEEQVKSRDEVLARTQLNNSQLAAQVRAANDERNKMVAQLQRSEQDNQQLKGKNQQLQRLVSVLRKKVAEGTVKTV